MAGIDILGDRGQIHASQTSADRWEPNPKQEEELCSQANVGECGGVGERPASQGLRGAPLSAERSIAVAAGVVRPEIENPGFRHGPRGVSPVRGSLVGQEYMDFDGGGREVVGRASPPEPSVPFPIESVLLRHRLIPVVRLSSVEKAVPLAQALQRAGLPLLLIELTSRAGLPAIEKVRSALADFYVGAGAVRSSGQIWDTVHAGALFGAGPAMNPALLETARTAGFPFMPGAMTPSDIELGVQWGFSCQGICPAAALGGAQMVRALAEPYLNTNLLLVPTGGLTMADFQAYLTVPQVGAVAGRFVCEHALVEAAVWEDVEAQAALCRRKVWAALWASRHSWVDEDEARGNPPDIHH